MTEIELRVEKLASELAAARKDLANERRRSPARLPTRA